MCLGAAFAAKLGTVIYGIEPPRRRVTAFEQWDLSRDAEGMPGYRLPELTGGVLREETAAMFREYANSAEEGSWAAVWAGNLAALAGI